MKDLLLLLRQTELKLKAHARQISLVRKEMEKEMNSRGVLGSRGLTQFILEHLEFSSQTDPRRFTTSHLVQLARLAGYAAPSPADLTKRLSEYARRTGKVDNVRGEGWRWRGAAGETDGREEEEGERD